MDFDKTIKKIRIYSIISFLLPLVTINVCLLIYKTLGTVEAFPNYQYNLDKFEYEYRDYHSINMVSENMSFTNCPKYKYVKKYITSDNETITKPPPSSDQFTLISKKILKLRNNNELKTVIYEKTNILNPTCVQNHKFLYLILNNSTWVEKILLKSRNENTSGFSKVKNPYLYGEVSISRTARYFPTKYIFKTFLIISALFLFLYWRNNLNLFNKLKDNKKLYYFSNKFYYFGIFSCLFLALHATFFGINIESKNLDKIRRLIIILFIFCEVVAQLLLTINIYKFKEALKKKIRPIILTIKILFILTIILGTCLVFFIMIFKDPNIFVINAIEWNYFSLLLFYYFLTSLIWKKK